MPHKSLREIRAELRRSLTTDRYVDALLVVVEPDGTEVYRAGGVWDKTLGCYDRSRTAEPLVFRLKLSQIEAARAFAEWFRASLRGDKKRDRVLMLGGPGGSGKTTMGAGPETVACALQWPGEVQFAVNLQAKLREECMEALRESSRPEWIEYDSDNPVDSRTIFITGHRIRWKTAKNAAALRERKLPIRRVYLNEAQDMAERVFANAILATRNLGGLLTILANPNQDDIGEWSSELWEKLQGKRLRGRQFFLDPALNDGVDHAALDDIGDFLRAVAPTSYVADILGKFNSRDGKGYPNFSPIERETDEAGQWVRGHIGEPPPIPDIGVPSWPVWRDVTREETSRIMGPGSVGYDWIGGSDFQVDPGCCVCIAKLYRDQFDNLILFVRETISAPGDERALTQALVSGDYFPGDVDFDGNPRPGRSLLLVGDGTSSTHSTGNRRGEPYTFTQLNNMGWRTIPPDRHYKTRTALNPLVTDSRKQMFGAFAHGWILLHHDCEKASAVLPSLVDGLKRTRVLPSGKFEKKGHWTHKPDGLRYLAWRFLPRSGRAPLPPRNSDVIREIRSISITDR